MYTVLRPLAMLIAAALLLQGVAQTQDATAEATAPTLLSAYFGLDNALPLGANGLCRGAKGQDGMPVIFSALINPDTLQADDFAVVSESGAVHTPICAILKPAVDPGELRTVLLIGELGNDKADAPVRVDVVGDILTSGKAVLNFSGASVAVTPLAAGPVIVLAEYVPQNEWTPDQKSGRNQGSGCPAQGTVQIVRVTWAGGVTRLNGDEAGDVERAQYRVVLRQSDGRDVEATPFVLADLGDGDNNHLLCLDQAGTPMMVSFAAGFLYDPNHDTANPETSVPVLNTAPPKDKTKSRRNVRYCEVLPIYRNGLSFKAEVYNTLGLNDCPADAWKALDAKTLAAELGAFTVNLNGPRYWVLDEIAAAGGLTQAGKQASFGGIEMTQRAVLDLSLQDIAAQKPYSPHTVQRSTNYVFYAGEQVYELVSPTGEVFVMQSYSQIVDPTLTIDDLETLGTRLTLPEGWQYRTRRLEQDLQLVAVENATVIQDDLLNSYQQSHGEK